MVQGWRSGDTQAWIPGGHKWKEVQQEAAVLEHRKALKEVEKECIQRMEEMDKMGFAGTAFRHRKQIMEAVRNRNKRLHDLLDKCNEMARAATLTHTLTWDDAVGTTMEERMITILGGMSDLELASSAWAQPQIRQAIRAKVQADRAMEELQLVGYQRFALYALIRTCKNFDIYDQKSQVQISQNL
ncbi:hypothetical protein QFC24_005096 [Naganishia onofrii]|uniref:Uncharacterized protein n=1 Tax=Naganishia onofrii TaxID=1851511 RepID=A0ACC2XCJ5_9TREE|nr:hypothetical protein QFC24_005096 [Naganishia onofrii]